MESHSNNSEFNAYKYACDFEKIAVKIVEHVLSTNQSIWSSGITKATRDYGVDGVVVIKNSASQNNTVITVEAKLRNLPIKLSLRDIATSVVCFLVRYGKKHYIVTNTYLTAPTVEILSRFQQGGEHQFQYISGKETYDIISQVIDSLDNDLQTVAQIIQEHFLKNSDELQTIDLPIPAEGAATGLKEFCPLQSQANIAHKICQALTGNVALFVLYGDSGVGKFFVSQQVAASLGSVFHVFTFHALTYHSPRQFFLQLMNTLLGISIHEVLYAVTQEHHEILSQLAPNSDLPEQKYALEMFQKLFSMKALDSEGVEFLIYQYIREFFSQQISQPYLIILHGYTDQAKELSKFILKYLPELPRTIKFLILAEDPWGNTSLIRESCVIQDPSIQLQKMNPLERDEAIQYIQWGQPHISDTSAAKIYQELGGNMDLLSEMLHAPQSLIDLPQYHSILSGQFETVLRKQIEQCLMFPESPEAKLLFLISLFRGSIPLYAYNILQRYNPAFNCSAPELAGLIIQTPDAVELSKPFMSQYLKGCFFQQGASYRKFSIELIKKSKSENWLIFEPMSQVLLLFFAFASEFEERACLELKRCRTYMEFSMQYDLLDLLSRYYQQKEQQINDSQLQDKRLETELAMYELLVQQDIINSRDFTIKADYLSRVLRSYKISYSQQSNKRQKFVSQIFIRYALASYQLHMRNNSLDAAQSALQQWHPYLEKCGNPQLFSQYTRYSALLLKETGHIAAFLEKLRSVHEQYPQNCHLTCVYFANRAAVHRMSDPAKALQILENNALPHVINLSDFDLRLWLQNDAITYRILKGQTDWTKLTLEAKEILEQAQMGCLHQNEARAYNNLGVISIIQEDDESARDYFYEAVRQMIIYEQNFICFYLAANYLQCSTFDTNQQRILEFCLQFCEKEQEMLLKKFHDPDCPRQENNMFAAFLAVCRTAKIHNLTAYSHLRNLYSGEFCDFSSEILKTSTLHRRFWCGGRIIILF